MLHSRAFPTRLVVDVVGVARSFGDLACRGLRRVDGVRDVGDVRGQARQVAACCTDGCFQLPMLRLVLVGLCEPVRARGFGDQSELVRVHGGVLNVGWFLVFA
jgi:hypothetical protein